MHMLAEYALFSAKILTTIVAILLLFLGILGIAARGKEKTKGKLEVKKLNDKYKQMRETLNNAILHKHQLKALMKTLKSAEKAAEKAIKGDDKVRKKIFVIRFKGDIKASATNALCDEVTALLTVASKDDEVVACIESPGGVVHGYGLAASQLKRIRDVEIPLTVCVDKIAASGGYMIACVANTILAAPFAIVGSIGVIAQLPNFHKLLQKKDIDYEQIMAGEYKRTLTMFGENTDKGREKFQEEVNDTHELFKAFIAENRPKLNIDKVATGEHWYGSHALELKLIDKLITSDDYLLSKSDDADIFEVKYSIKKPMLAKMAISAQAAIDKCVYYWTGPRSNA